MLRIILLEAFRILCCFKRMKEKFRIGLQCLLICALPAFLCDAQVVHPTGQQIIMKWGHVNEVNGVRKVVSTEAEYDSHNQHGLKFVKARE